MPSAQGGEAVFCLEPCLVVFFVHLIEAPPQDWLRGRGGVARRAPQLGGLWCGGAGRGLFRGLGGGRQQTPPWCALNRSCGMKEPK